MRDDRRKEERRNKQQGNVPDMLLPSGTTVCGETAECQAEIAMVIEQEVSALHTQKNYTPV